MFKTHLTFRFDGAGAAVWLLVSLVVGVVASLLPAWRGARVPVREALGYE
jgi:ABC-type lipoprotein release transport system permease subunit